MERKRRIYTHISVDIDAVSSVWFASRFMFPEENLDIRFVSANWDGEEMEKEDVALDIHAGGKGIKGRTDKNGKVHSCFASLVFACEDKEVKKTLKTLSYLIDKHDAFGSSSGGNKKNISAFIGLSISLRSLQAKHKSDYMVVSRMFEILDGLYEINKAKEDFRKNIGKYVEVVGRTALLIVEGQSATSSRGLFQRGFDAVVYVDGYSIGLLVRDGHSIDQPELKDFFRKSGEENEWYFHSAGYMVSRGTRKSPAETTSRIDPYQLAKVWEGIRKNIYV